MGPTPLRPASKADQLASVPTPSGDTIPIPVMTTRRSTLTPDASRSASSGVALDVFDGVGDGGDLLRILVADLYLEGLLERHHQLHRVQGVGAEVVHERGFRGDFFGIHSQLLHDDVLDLFLNGHSLFLLDLG